MTRRQGRRPRAIKAFTALFLLQAAVSFWHQMAHLAETEATLASFIPRLAIDRDLAIVVTCARLTIAVIPVALIWFLGSRVARVLVMLFVAVRLFTIPYAPSVEWVASLTMAVAAALVLLSPSAAGWFRKPAQPGEHG